ncbi:unnamed protein product [Penicillium discolor]
MTTCCLHLFDPLGEDGLDRRIHGKSRVMLGLLLEATGKGTAINTANKSSPSDPRFVAIAKSRNTRFLAGLLQHAVDKGDILRWEGPSTVHRPFESAPPLNPAPRLAQPAPRQPPRRGQAGPAPTQPSRPPQGGLSLRSAHKVALLPVSLHGPQPPRAPAQLSEESPGSPQNALPAQEREANCE